MLMSNKGSQILCLDFTIFLMPFGDLLILE